MTRNNTELKFISLVAIAFLVIDIFTAQGLLFLLSILNLVLLATGLILLSKMNVRPASNYLVFGYFIALILSGAEALFTQRFRPSISSLYFIKCLIFACGAIYAQQITRTPDELSNDIYKMFFFCFKLSSRYKKFFVIGVALIFFAILSIGFYPKISCAVSGGEYTIGGLIEAEYCLYNYSDGGKACSSSTECQGECMLDKSTSSLSDNIINGVCKSNSDPYGCFSYVENGKFAGGACTD